jgi:hypothetical protein
MAKGSASSKSMTFHHREADWHGYAGNTVCRPKPSVRRHRNRGEVENYLPSLRVHHRIEVRRRIELELISFSSHIFDRIRRNYCVKVVGIPGVLSLVGAKSSQPNPIFRVETVPDRSVFDYWSAQLHLINFVDQTAPAQAGTQTEITRMVIGNKNSLRVVPTLEPLMQWIEANGVGFEALDSDCTEKRDGLKRSDARSLQNFGNNFRCLGSSSNRTQSQESSLQWSMGRMDRQLE